MPLRDPLVQGQQTAKLQPASLLPFLYTLQLNMVYVFLNNKNKNNTL